MFPGTGGGEYNESLTTGSLVGFYLFLIYQVTKSDLTMIVASASGLGAQFMTVRSRVQLLYPTCQGHFLKTGSLLS